MKKWLLMGSIAFVAVLGVALISGAFLAGTAIVKAQAPTPETPFGNGMRGGGGMMGGDTEIHDAIEEAMHTALAEKLGLTVAELDAQIAEGKNFWQIAEEKGLTEEEITTLMTEAHTAALAKLVADGVMTQEQADLMSQRGAGMMGGRGGRGGCTMTDGDGTPLGTIMRGFGQRGSGMRGNR